MKSLRISSNQLVDLVGGSLTIIAGDADVDVVRDRLTLQIFDLAQDVARDSDTVRALFLGDGERDCLGIGGFHALGRGRAGVIAHHPLRFAGTQRHGRDIAHIDRSSIDDADDQRFDVFGTLQKSACIKLEALIRRFKFADAHLAIRRPYRLRDLIQSDAVSGQPFRLDFDPRLFPAPVHDEALAGVRNLFDPL
jgi:hypothetical protein